MNLLPQPRHVDPGRGRVAYAPASIRRDASLPPEGYRLSIDPDGIEISAADDAGIFYARCTLDQLRQTEGEQLPVCVIRDWPDIPVRAVMLDIARDKVPTMDTLRALVDRLASWKVNQLQLYMEHTFAYRDHQEVWAGASPLSHGEVTELGAFCRERHMDLVPNQNCFGHMERWLKHERYRPLAMAPEGWRNPRGVLKPPTTIDPSKPGSLALVRDLLGELVPCFGGKQVNVGLDEPWEMPPERYPEYLQWISTLRSLPELNDREMVIWGD
ncbi:MAG: glycoside hydrolase family 20 zincin-like fold domain-containing protein, partial [Acidimicrobiales bacterium]